jgi:hypothetical protein
VNLEDIRICVLNAVEKRRVVGKGVRKIDGRG